MWSVPFVSEPPKKLSVGPVARTIRSRSRFSAAFKTGGHILKHFRQHRRARGLCQATHGSDQGDASLGQRMHLAAEHNQLIEGDLLPEDRQTIQSINDRFRFLHLPDGERSYTPSHQFGGSSIGIRSAQQTLLDTRHDHPCPGS